MCESFLILYCDKEVFHQIFPRKISSIAIKRLEELMIYSLHFLHAGAFTLHHAEVKFAKETDCREMFAKHMVALLLHQ